VRDVRIFSVLGAVTAVRTLDSTATRQAHALSKFEARAIVGKLRSDSDRTALVALYALAMGVEPHEPARIRDAELISAIENAVDAERILFTRDGAFGGQQPHVEKGDAATSAAATLARAIMGSRGELAFEGRRYRLIGTERSESRDDSDGYRLVGPAETKTLLPRMAESIATTPAEKARWDEAVALATKQGQRREGLSLLRFVPVQAPTKTTTAEPAATPSQLRAKIAPDAWIEIEIVYDDGTAYLGNCVVEAPDGSVTEGPPDEDGVVRMKGLTPGACKFKLPALDTEVFKTA
jgi:hypothetical protein